MQKILNNLRLSTKLYFTVVIAIFTMAVITAMFYIGTKNYMQTVELNQITQEHISSISKEIEKDLKTLEYLTIHNAILPQQDYKQKSIDLYKSLLNNIAELQKSPYFQNEPKSKKTIQKITNRIKGFKIILDSLAQEVSEDSEDGLYAILALVSVSQKISSELEDLNNIIKYIAKDNIDKTNQQMSRFLYIAMAMTMGLFFFFIYINRMILSSILKRIHNLRDEIISFFDLLSNKRSNIIHINDDGKDEIAEIANVIDEHMYIAENLLLQEREESKRIEAKVKEATAEIVALNKEIEATQREIVFTMGAIAEERSKETRQHVERVAEYSMILARLYGLSFEESLLLKNASPMHDIGKVAIPDAILNKPGRFTDEEFEVMKSHAEIGYKMLQHSNKSILKIAAIVAHEHHERWDGKGYPRGLKGEDIHIYGRITAIADVFDALGSDRVYKEAWPLEKILKLFEEERGKQFDPKLVDIFLGNLDHILAAKKAIESDSPTSLTNFIENFEKSMNI